jgi:uncharacterized protein (DUF427 family)
VTSAMGSGPFGLPPVYYLPVVDVPTDLPKATEHRTRGPCEGLASYWSVKAGDDFVPDAAWAHPDQALDR